MELFAKEVAIFYTRVKLNHQLNQTFEVDSGSAFTLLANGNFKKMNFNIQYEGKFWNELLFVVPDHHSPVMGTLDQTPEYLSEMS